MECAQSGREGASTPRFPVLVNYFVVGVGDVDEHVDLIENEMPLLNQVPRLEKVQPGAIADSGSIQHLSRAGLQRLAEDARYAVLIRHTHALDERVSDKQDSFLLRGEGNVAHGLIPEPEGIREDAVFPVTPRCLDILIGQEIVMVVWIGAPEGIVIGRIKDDAGQYVQDEDEKQRREDQCLPRVAFEQVFSLFRLSLSLFRLFSVGLVHRLDSTGGAPRRRSPADWGPGQEDV